MSRKKTPEVQFLEACLRLVPPMKREPGKCYRAPLDDQLELRSEFLEACFRLVPELKEELRREVVPLRAPDSLEQSDDYRSALHSWADRHNLGAPWAVESVHNGVRNWRAPESDDFPIIAVGSSGSAHSWDDFNIKLEFPGWDPVADGTGDALEAFFNLLRDELSRYLARQVARAEQLGVAPVTERRPRANTPEQRTEWLVRRVVQRWAKPRVVAHYRLGSRTAPENAANNVRKETNTLARVIDIEIPSPRRAPRG